MKKWMAAATVPVLLAANAGCSSHESAPLRNEGDYNLIADKHVSSSKRVHAYIGKILINGAIVTMNARVYEDGYIIYMGDPSSSDEDDRAQLACELTQVVDGRATSSFAYTTQQQGEPQADKLYLGWGNYAEAQPNVVLDKAYTASSVNEFIFNGSSFSAVLSSGNSDGIHNNKVDPSVVTGMYNDMVMVLDAADAYCDRGQ